MPSSAQLPNSLNWVVVDFDGTLAVNMWSIDSDPIAHLPIGAPIYSNIGKLNKLRAQGYKIAVHTARPWSDYDALKEWLRLRCPYDVLMCGKFLAAAYIDDRAIPAGATEWIIP